MVVKSITFGPSYIEVTDDSGNVRKHDLTNIVRAGDIPDLTISSMSLLTTLAQVLAVVVKTLIDQDILDESLVDGYDLQYVVDTLNTDLNNAWDDV